MCKYDNLYIVANLPYYITTPIINKIVSDKITVKEMVIMIQKEVADRLSSKPGSRDYGQITVFLNYFFEIEKVLTVSKNCFVPKPKVDSAVIKMKRREQKELVKRCESKQDKRVTYIEITDKGKDVLLANRREAEQFLTNVLKRMGEADMMEFMRLCERMREAMEEEIKELKKGKDRYEENP